MANQDRAKASERNDLIDVFRALSILTVLFFHYTVMGLDLPHTGTWMLGKLGVEVFFCISGLVITMTALRSKGAADFAARRFFRIYPTFFLACTITFIILSLHDPIGHDLHVKDYLGSLTFAPDRLGLKFIDGAYWSLFVEALFYGTVAVSLVALRERFWMGVLVLLVFGAIARPLLSKAIGVLLIAQFSGFFLLGMAGWYAIYEKDRRAGAMLFCGAVVSFALNPLLGEQWPAIPVALTMLGLLALGVNGTFGPLAWIGRCSYPLYLIHQNLGVAAIRDLLAMSVPPVAAILLTATGALGVAALLHYFVEEPSNKALTNWWRRRRRRPSSIEPNAAALLTE